MGQPQEFTITVSDQVFVLTEDQIHRDAPNYFTTLFEGSFKEAREGTQEMKLYRDPYLFKFIHMHLSGYAVLPLPIDNIPCHLGLDSTTTSSLVKLVSPFFGRTLSVVSLAAGAFSGCGRVVSLFLSFFSSPPSHNATPSSPPPLLCLLLFPSLCFLAALFPLSSTFDVPLVLLTFSAERRPHPPRVSLILPPFPSPFALCLDAPRDG